MAGNKPRERLRPSRHGDRPRFDLVQSKLRPPPLRRGTVRRSSLIERLRRDDTGPIVSLVTPAGYGKTMLLSQWAEGNGQAFAWVSADERDNDPKVLLTYVAAALDAVEPVGERVFDALASPASSVPGSVVPRLGSAFASFTTPVVLVVDDVHLLGNSECRAALSVLADHVPPGSRLVLAGRDRPPLPVARLRAEGRILEIGPGDLALTVQEAARLLRAAEVTLGPDEVAALHQRTEGWAAGLYLAALAIRAGGSTGSAASFGGADLFVAEYVESEFLDRISLRQRNFLIWTAVLERMCGPLCEAVMRVPGSAADLEDLARSNVLLVPLDHRGEWYRHHHLFRDMLLAQLQRLEPELIPVLRRRAADWCLRNDLPDAALEYSMAAGDVDAVAHLVEGLWHQAYREGRSTTRQQWIQWLDDRDGMRGHPLLAVQAALTAAHTGRVPDAERWADAVDHWQHQQADRARDPVAEAWAAALRADSCRHGVEQMRADADEFARAVAVQGTITGQASFAKLQAPLLQGIARILCGDPEDGEAFLEKAISTEDAGAAELRARALCQRSLLAMNRHEWKAAEAFACQARSVLRASRDEDGYTTPLVCAVQARVAAHHGDASTAREQLVRAQRLRHLLTCALPVIAVQARIELARVHLALADLAGARTLMREIDELLIQRPDLGTLTDEAAALRVQLSRQRGASIPEASALTAAELRLLPLLATHLTAAEIAAQLYLSPHTIKAEVKSIYRKLGASSRNEAIARARDLGLLDG